MSPLTMPKSVFSIILTTFADKDAEKLIWDVLPESSEGRLCPRSKARAEAG